MKKLHQKRLAKLALALLANRNNVNLNMGYFCANEEYCDLTPKEWECGTSCCFAGYAPEVFQSYPSFRKLLSKRGSRAADWGDVCIWLIGADSWNKNDSRLNDLWENLFGALWPNDALQAVRRALYALENPEEALSHEWSPFEFRPYKSFNPKKLEERLSAFL